MTHKNIINGRSVLGSADVIKENWKYECLELKDYEVTVKGRGCAYGRNYRNWLSKEDSSLPTVSTEFLMISFIIDAIEARDVVTSDIPWVIFIY